MIPGEGHGAVDDNSCCAIFQSQAPAQDPRVSETNRKIVFFVAGLIALGVLLYGTSKLLDLNIDFSSHAGGLAMGGVVALLITAGFTIYYKRKADAKPIFDPSVSTTTRVVAFMVIATALVVILGMKTSQFDFSTQWKGLVVGGVVTSLAVKIAWDLTYTALIKKEATESIQPDHPTATPQASKEAFSVQKASKVFGTSLIMTVIMGGALYGGLHLLGASPEAMLTANASSLVAGGVTAIVAAGALYVYRRRDKFTSKELCALLVVGVIATIALVILDRTHLFSVGDAFKPWEGAVVGAGFTAIVLMMTAISRRKSEWEGKLGEESLIQGETFYNTDNNATDSFLGTATTPHDMNPSTPKSPPGQSFQEELPPL